MSRLDEEPAPDQPNGVQPRAAHARRLGRGLLPRGGFNGFLVLLGAALALAAIFVVVQSWSDDQDAGPNRVGRPANAPPGGFNGDTTVGRIAIARTLAITPYIAFGSPRKKEVALTFDDGPSAYTREVITILKREKVPATFFVVSGEFTENGPVLRELINSGFDVGDHTITHPKMGALSEAQQRREIAESATRIQQAGAPFPQTYRPPFRSYNATTLKILRSMRMLMVLWSVDTFDYMRPGVDRIVSSAVGGARPGSIVLMHDGGGDRSQTVSALPGIIRGLRAKGYRLVSIPQLLQGELPPRNQRLSDFSE